MNSPKKNAFPILKNMKQIQTSDGQKREVINNQPKRVDTQKLSQHSIEQAKLKYLANQIRQQQQKSLPPITRQIHCRSVSVQGQPIITQKQYYYYVGEGNNEQLIKKLLDDRQQWICVKDPKSKNINFKWQETEKGYEFKSLRQKDSPLLTLNHFEFHSEISDKFKLAMNLKAHCDVNFLLIQKKRLNIYDYTPSTFAIECTQENLKSELFQFISFYRTNCPANKLNELDKTIKSNFFNYTTLYDSKINQYPTLFAGENIWIFKPSNMNQGRGIHVVRNLQEILDVYNKYLGGYQEKLFEVKRNEQNEIIKKITYLNTLTTDQFVIQKYIEKPLLINERKFDIRAYVLISSNLQVYFYKEGQLRLATEKYDVKQQSNYVHLTNNAVQFSHPEYGKTEEGNQYTFDLASQYFNFDFRQVLLVIMKQIVTKLKQISLTAFSAVKRKINKQKRKNCFEMFGMDFILDEQFKPWLIEVNTNPSLEVTSKMLGQLFPRLINDAFKITIDNVFPQPEGQPTYPLLNYHDAENLWEFIGSLQN